MKNLLLVALALTACGTRLASTQLTGKKCDAARQCAAGFFCDTATDTCVANGSVLNQAPLAVPGANQTLTANAPKTSVLLDGSASSDPDGDPLTYAWKEGETTLSNNVKSTVGLPKGLHHLLLTVSDGKAQDEKPLDVQINNAVPFAKVHDTLFATADSSGAAAVTLDMSACGDVDGDPVQFNWSEEGNTTALKIGNLDPANPVTVHLASGKHKLTLTLTDSDGATATVTTQVTVEASPALTVTLLAPSDNVVATGQTFEVVALVTNSGGATAKAVTPGTLTPSDTSLIDAGTGPIPATVDVESGKTQQLKWIFQARAPGTLHFSLDGVAGVDANNNAAVASPAGAQSQDVTIAKSATLVATFLATPSPVDVGRDFGVVVHVANPGGVAADNVTVTLSKNSGDGIVSRKGVVPPAVSIAAGSAQDFAFTYTAQAAGTVVLSAAVVGLDHADRTPKQANTTSAPLVLQPITKVFTALAVAPERCAGACAANVGQNFNVTMTVTNQSAGAITTVSPSPLTTDGNAKASLVSGPNPASIASLSSGGAATFTWTYSATQRGALALIGNATLQDAAIQPVTANGSRSALLTIQSAAQIQVLAIHAPSSATAGTNTDVSIDVQNSGEAGAQLTAATLGFTAGSKGADNDFVITPIDSLPLAAPGGKVTTLHFTVLVKAGATLQADTLNATISATDNNDTSTQLAASTDATSAATLLIQSPPSLVVSTVTTSATGAVSQGQVATVLVKVTNAGGAAANLTATKLTFTRGSVDATSDYDVTPSAKNPTTVDAAVSGNDGVATVSFQVAVHANAASGLTSIDPRISATDANAGTDASPTFPTGVAAMWTVQTAAKHSVSSIVADASVSSGEAAARVAVTVTNSGEATFVLDAAKPVTLSFQAADTKADVTSDYVCTADASNAGFVTSGNPVTLVYLCAVSATAAPRTVSLSASVSGADKNSSTTAAVASGFVASWAVQSPAQIVLASLSAPTSVTQGQSAVVVTAQVQNLGGALADVTAATLSFKASGADRSGDYTVTTTSQNVTILGGTTASVQLAVQVHAGALANTAVILDGAIAALDDNSKSTIDAPTAAPHTASWTVSPNAQVAIGAVTVPQAFVSKGQQNLRVTVTASNSKALDATIQSAALTFTRAATNDAQSDFTVTADSNNATTVPAGGSVTLGYTVGVSSGATSGAVTVGAAISAHDSQSNILVVTGPESPGNWMVQSRAQLVLSAVGPSPTANATVSQGQNTAALTVTVTNVGEAKLDLLSVTPIFKSSGVSVGSAFTATPVAGNPSSVSGNKSVALAYSVAVSASAPTGVITLDAMATGSDDNTGAAAVGSPAATVSSKGQWIVQTPAKFSMTSVAVPLSATVGQQGLSVVAQIRNTGGANANVTAAGLLFTLSGGDVSTQYTSTLSGALPSLASGATAQLAFTVAVSKAATLGNVVISASATAVDANSGTSAGTVSQAGTLLVQSPPALTAILAVGPSIVQTDNASNNTITVTMAVSNASGASTADNVLPSALTLSGSGSATLSAQPSTRASISGGSSRSFTWTYVATNPCAVAFRGNATGTDHNTGAAAITAAVTSSAVTIKRSPSANAGSSFQVFRDDHVTLDGSGSVSTDCDANLNYHWTQTSGTPYAVALSGVSSASPTFEALGGSSTPLTFDVTVSQSNPARSSTASVQVTVNDLQAFGTNGVSDSAWSGQHGISVDASGRLALATDGGGYVYDGAIWRTLSQGQGSAVRAALFDQQGRVWFGAANSNALRRFTVDWTGGNDTVEPFALHTSGGSDPAGIAALALAPGSNASTVTDLWVASERDVWLMPAANPGTVQRFSPAGSRSGASCLFPAGSGALPYAPCVDSYYAIGFDGAGHLYAANDVSLFETTALTWGDKQTDDVFQNVNDQVRAIAPYLSSELWIGSGVSVNAAGASVAANGAAHLNPGINQPWASTRFDHLSTGSSVPMPSNDVRGIAVDAAGDIWMAVAGGIYRYKRAAKNFLAYKAGSAGLPSGFDPTAVGTAFVGGQKTVYFTTSAGLYSFHQ